MKILNPGEDYVCPNCGPIGKEGKFLTVFHEYWVTDSDGRMRGPMARVLEDEAQTPLGIYSVVCIKCGSKAEVVSDVIPGGKSMKIENPLRIVNRPDFSKEADDAPHKVDAEFAADCAEQSANQFVNSNGNEDEGTVAFWPPGLSGKC
jgi:hypothetical protein